MPKCKLKYYRSSEWTGCVVLTLIGEEPWQSKFKAMLLFCI